MWRRDSRRVVASIVGREASSTSKKEEVPPAEPMHQLVLGVVRAAALFYPRSRRLVKYYFSVS